MSYTKLFQSIITSTIWMEDDQTRIVWITMLASADKNGEVSGTIPGLARLAGVGIPETERALNKFQSPDPYSRTPDNEGRRIEKIDGGWVILNHSKYRKLASKEDQKTKAAERKRRERERNQGGVTSHSVTQGHAKSVTCHAENKPSHADVTQRRDIAEAEASANAEAEADAEANSLSNERESEREDSCFAEIPTWGEVLDFAKSNAILPQTAESFFKYHENNAYWLNKFDRLIPWKKKIRDWKVKGQTINASGQQPKYESAEI